MPLRINQIHSWEMRLTDAQGNPVSGAAIAITGGMPLHDHGLPTLPSVTAEPRAGSYLLEGVRFHMPGQWQLDIRVEHGSHIESFTVEFDL
ncbi:MAG: FixH family protein [Gammaproteobacteria bacterium]